MPLHVPTAPAPALRSVLTALRSPQAAHDIRTPAVARAAQDALRPELPLPLYEMAGVGPGTPPRVRLAAWRFLLREVPVGRDGAPAGEAAARPAVGAAEAMLTADGWAFSRFSEGPYVLSTERALQQAESLPAQHSPRLLSLPQLYMLMLWLHRPAEDDPTEGSPATYDILIPLSPAPPGIHAHRPHRFDALLPLLARRMVSGPLLMA